MRTSSLVAEATSRQVSGLRGQAHRGFVAAFGHQAQEALVAGHVGAFAAWAGVPRRIRYDNLKPAVTRVLLGRDRVENERFVALRSHYGFDSFFCRPGRAGAHEKGGVEGEVGRFRRNHLVPVPAVASMAGLAELLTAAMRTDERRRVAGRSQPVKVMFAGDATALWPLPDEPFDTMRELTARVDAKARICVLQAHYSVPARLAGRRVGVRLGAEHLEVCDADGRVVAAHPRSLSKHVQHLQLDHYLEVLGVKPGALAGSAALAQARAAGLFTATHDRFWAAARQAHGDRDGTRRLIEVLLLHRRMPAGQVLAGVAAVLSAGSTDPALVAIEARRLAEPGLAAVIDLDAARTAGLDGYDRPAPSLDGYDQLLDGGTVVPIGGRR